MKSNLEMKEILRITMLSVWLLSSTSMCVVPESMAATAVAQQDEEYFYADQGLLLSLSDQNNMLNIVLDHKKINSHGKSPNYIFQNKDNSIVVYYKNGDEYHKIEFSPQWPIVGNTKSSVITQNNPNTYQKIQDVINNLAVSGNQREIKHQRPASTTLQQPGNWTGTQPTSLTGTTSTTATTSSTVTPSTTATTSTTGTTSSTGTTSTTATPSTTATTSSTVTPSTTATTSSTVTPSTTATTSSTATTSTTATTSSTGTTSTTATTSSTVTPTTAPTTATTPVAVLGTRSAKNDLSKRVSHNSSGIISKLEKKIANKVERAIQSGKSKSVPSDSAFGNAISEANEDLGS